MALKVEPKPTKGLFRLPIDRVFTLKGFGTVVTGTAVSGSISIDDAIEILPSKYREQSSRASQSRQTHTDSLCRPEGSNKSSGS